MVKLSQNDTLISKAYSFLKEKIAIPSYSFNEESCANFICNYLEENKIVYKRLKNNIIACSKDFKEDRATLMLNSHIDTVKESNSYTFDPFNPAEEADKILGLGSNDAGASVTAMLHTFLYFYEKDLDFNLLLVLTAEEERSGSNGMDLVIKSIAPIDFAIIGEPTQMRAAIAERGLLVIDAESRGVSGHAAREDGINAIYQAITDIEILKKYNFERRSPLMGDVKLTVTQIEAGSQHNVVPDLCRYVIDIRPTELYNNLELIELLQKEVKSSLKARSLTNKSSSTPLDTPLVETLKRLNIEQFVSPTTSDWMRIDIPAIKMGPGDSTRSHQADEFIYKDEIIAGIEGYINFINNFKIRN